MFNLKNTFRSFKYYNFRLFFFGQGLSLIGTWMQQIAAPWLVYRITDSPFLLGLTSFVGMSPNFLITPISGVIADKLDRKKILYFTQINMMISAFLLAFFYFKDNGSINYGIILLLLFYNGLMNAIDGPTRQAIIFDIVEEKNDLPNAIALNSAMFNGARLIGPSLAGIVLAKWNEGVCFVINGISFFTVLIALYFMRLKIRKKTKLNSIDFKLEFKEGVDYIFKNKAILTILFIVIIISIFGMSYYTILPVYVKNVLKKDGGIFGFLLSFIGIGALGGALMIASIKNISFLTKQFFFAGAMFGIPLILLSFTKTTLWAAFLLLIIGFGMVSQVSIGNTLIQLLVDDNKRGRIMSFYNMAFLGSAPIGSIIVGFLAKENIIGIHKTLIFLGLVTTISSFYLIVRKKEFKKLFIG